MADFKLVIGSKDGKCSQKEVKDDEANFFIGKKVGEKVKGDDFGMPGYEFEITGGSDNAGFPMRRDVDGTLKKRILAVSGIGVKKKRKGQRQRKTVAGNEIYEKIVQINLKALKEGKKEAPKEEKAEKADDKKEEKKEEKKPVKEEKTEEKSAKTEDTPEEKLKEKKPKDKKEDKKEEKKE